MANSKKSDLSRCLGCPKPIVRSLSRRKPGDQVVEIQVGYLLPDTDKDKAPFQRKSTWGRMHLSCYRRALGTPDMLDDLDL